MLAASSGWHALKIEDPGMCLDAKAMRSYRAWRAAQFRWGRNPEEELRRLGLRPRHVLNPPNEGGVRTQSRIVRAR